jgi:hypothetical protein
LALKDTFKKKMRKGEGKSEEELKNWNDERIKSYNYKSRNE